MIYRLLGAVVWPSEAYWRAIEMRPLRNCPDLRPPILEVGCGEGAFTEELGLAIEDAVDLNPRAASIAAARPNYGNVEVIDMHELAGRETRYRTVFANSVLEHVSELQPALETIRRLLEPGGALVTTVPLVEMNRHLSLSSGAYVAWRQRSLEHRNLWSPEQWHDALSRAGFADVEFSGYLSGAECSYWDRVDVFGNLGVGRARVAPMLRRFGGMLPAGTRARIKDVLSRRLERHVASEGPGGEKCAALVVARAPG